MKNQIRSLIKRNSRNATETIVSLPVRCFICSLPVEKRLAVDNSLTQDDTSLSAIARQLGIAKASVWRHARNHLVPVMKEKLREVITEGAYSEARPTVTGAVRTVQTLDEFRAFNARSEVAPLFWKAKELMKTAEDARNFQVLKWFLSEARLLLELAGRFDGDFSREGVIVAENFLVVLPRADRPAVAAQVLDAEKT
jgi:hypothetical protein